MKYRRLLPILLLLALLPGCALAPARTARERSIFAMDTVMDLRVYARDDTMLDALNAELNRLDRLLSATNPESALAALNRTGRSADAELAELAGRAAEISARTGGSLDICLYAASCAWGFPTDAFRVPDAAELDALMPRSGMDKLTRAGSELTLSDGAQMDFGAVAKGWAADLCRQKLETAGVSGILSLGGNIQTVGAKPDGSDWIVGVQDPEDPSRNRLTLRLKGSKAVVNSGDYQRYFERDGVRYCHILDPETLRPVQNGLRAVTVVADSGLLADGLSTALFVMGKEAGIAHWRQSNDFEAIWIGADGSVAVTEGLASAVSDQTVEVIRR